MKTITNIYNVYSLEELPKEAQEKAHEQWIRNNDYYFLEEYLNERLCELLEAKDIKHENNKTFGVQYSLGYCQGDGAMFTGEFTYKHKGKNYSISVRQSGKYYHYNSKVIVVYSEDGDDIEDGSEYWEVEKAFNDDYMSIAKQLEKDGYSYIEYEDSFESFKESCEANEYTFTIDGTMDNSN